ncbi:response regulator transcription factor [Fulvivirgaceae bacterium PWU20]|uniref:Response regulator transcription factor n=2 Tax=Chryseosolibacter indicus TaxID=2782351 RepID=A0ABS5VSD0_9BACT|nr:response regulator transcription factor [Chryseosolibacter indicus]
MLTSLFPIILKYLKDNSSEVRGTDYRYSCSFKMRNIKGAYYWYLVDTAVIEEDENGYPIRTLITCTNIHQFKKDEIIYYNILKKNKEGMYEVMLEGVEDNNKDEYQLTPREIQIINLISRGFSNKEIADRLFISLNTIKTHRKNVLKKTQCKGTAELTNFAFSRGLL